MQTGFALDNVTDVRKLIDAHFYEKALSLPELISDFWQTDAAAETIIAWCSEHYTVLGITQRNKSQWGLLLAEKGDADTVIALGLRMTSLSCQVAISVASPTHGHSRAVIEELAKQFSRLESEKKADEINVRFWYKIANGGSSEQRAIEAPSWADIRDNYTADVRADMERMMAYTPETLPRGRLILWTGDPGTGKTYALRALLREWTWCHGEYVSDPEQFLSDAEYLMDVMLSTTQGEEGGSIWNEDTSEWERIRAPRWKLVILEDAGELVSKDAKSRVGQGLARLLNVTEGMLGQGLNVLILITTNEEVGALNEAVTRDGRCMAQRKFDLMSHEEVRAWFEARGVTPPAEQRSGFSLPNDHNKMTLAHMFALAEAAQQAQEAPVPA